MKQNLSTKDLILSNCRILILLKKIDLPYPLRVIPQDGLSENGVAAYLKFKLVNLIKHL